MTQFIQPTGIISAAQPTRWRRLLQSGIPADAIAALFLSAGLCRLFLPLTLMDAGFWNTIGTVFFSILLLLLLRIRWWITPAALLAGGGLLLWRDWQAELLQPRLAYWSAMFRWLVRDGSYHEIFSNSPLWTQLRPLLLFAVTGLLFLLLRRFCSVLVLLIVGIGAGALCAWIATQLWIPLDPAVGISLYTAGILMLLPRVYARSRKGTRHRRGSMQMIALPGAIVAVLLAWWIIPADTAEWRSRQADYLLRDISTLVQGPGSGSASTGNFSLFSTGTATTSGRLGGPVHLTDETVLHLWAEEPFLLRGAVMDTYTGTHWQTDSESGLRYESLFFRREQQESFDRNLPGAESADLWEDLSIPLTYQVSYQKEDITTVFAGGRVQRIDFAHPLWYSDMLFNRRGELYLPYGMPTGYPVTVEAILPRAYGPDTAARWHRLEGLAAEQEDPRYEDIQAEQTALPDSLPEIVRETALAITAEAETPYAKAVAIAVWLRENASYTLAPELPPLGSDFVANFLETREGYCTYYASAMAVMARSIGIPARYVTGYALEEDPLEEGRYRATGRTAHAWAEVYLAGIGWIAIDPLQWDAAAPLNSDRENPAAVDIPFDYYEEWEEDYLMDSDLDWNLLPLPEPEQVISPVLLLALSAALLLLGTILYLLWMWNSKYRRYSLPAVQRRYADNRRQFGIYYEDMIRQQSLLGHPPHPGETLLEYPRRIGRLLDENSRFGPIAEAQMRLHFADTTPTDEDIQRAATYHRALEDKLRAKLSRVGYLWKRALRRG